MYSNSFQCNDNVIGYIMSGDIETVKVFKDGSYKVLGNLAPLHFISGFSLDSWFEHRCIDTHRTNSRLLRKVVRLKTSDEIEISKKVHAVTVTDNFWYKEIDSKLTWKDVTFKNDKFKKVSLQGIIDEFEDKFVITPQLTLNGSFEKCWKLENGDWYMYKSGELKNQFSEIFIYRLLNNIGLPAASYMVEDKFVKTKDFTEGIYNYEPMFSLVDEDEDFELNCKVIESKFGVKALNDYLSILFMDALIRNPDRHTVNYGILRDKTTGEFVKMAPNFDNNLALLATSSIDRLPNEDLLIRDFCDICSEYEFKLPTVTPGMIIDAVEFACFNLSEFEVDKTLLCNAIRKRYSNILKRLLK